MKLPQKRISRSYQIVIPQLCCDSDFTEINKKEMFEVIQKNTQVATDGLRFEAYGVGRGAGNPAWGVDITSLIDSISKTKDLIEILFGSVMIINGIKKRLGKKRKVIYSSKFIENYCMGKILLNTKEEKLIKAEFIDLTGNDIEVYDYIDYYFFRFIGDQGSYLVIVDSSSNIIDCKLVNFNKVINIKLNK